MAQKHYVSLNQYDNEWSITHGEDVIFHGVGRVDFNNMPSFIKQVVDSLDSVEPKHSVRQQQSHTKRKAPATNIVEPLITTSWHQDAPYNDLMPTINGVHVPAGCATISTAQVINYYRYMQPWTASYDQVYYDGELFQHENVTWYDPSEVKCQEPVWHVEYSSTGWTNDIAPAKLCEGIAFAQKAFFYANETSTNYFTHYDGIRKKFGYLTEIKETDPYSISAVLKEQLDIQRPVIINAADNSNNGHSFIADGYNSEGEFHLNMGWGESWNCWGAPELWAYNQAMFTITLYPDYNDEALFIKDNEAGTAVFHNLTTGEVFRQELYESPVTDSYTGLYLHYVHMSSMELTAGEYEYCLEYKSGKQISAPMPEPISRELYYMYNHYSKEFVKGCSHLIVPNDCELTFYAQIEVVEQYGFNVILSKFKLDSYSVGNVDFSIVNQESTYNELAPTKYLPSYNGGKYIAKLDNLPAGKYKIFANVHSETIGEFKVGVGAGAIPCEGNNYQEVTLPYNIEGLDWTTFATIEQWTDASNPYVEPLMISLPEHESKGYYKIMLELGVGYDNGLRVNVRWNEINDEQESVIITFYNFNVDYRTYSSFENLDFSNVDGIKAYVASGIDPKNGTVYFTRVNKVSAHEGVLLKGKGNTRYNIPIVKEDLDASENLLIGNLFTRYINSNDKFTNYFFDDDKPGNMDFRICSDNQWISGSSTYLSLPTSDLGDNTVSKFRIILNDESISLNPQCNDGNRVYGTYSNTSAWVVPEELTVSAVRVDGESITLDNYATGDIVPANVGVLVSAAQGGNYTIELSNAEGTEKPNNALIGTGGGVTAEYMELIAPDKEYFRLTMHNGTQCGFWWGAENGTAFDLGANKAFLVTDVPASQNAARGFLLDGLITAINRVETTLTKNRAFNLYGQQVNANAIGIVIVNGKKVMNQ